MIIIAIILLIIFNILFILCLLCLRDNYYIIDNYINMRGIICDINPLSIYIKELHKEIEVKSISNYTYQLGDTVKIIKQEDNIYFIK